MGQEKPRFKTNVRKLKGMGLTESSRLATACRREVKAVLESLTDKRRRRKTNVDGIEIAIGDVDELGAVGAIGEAFGALALFFVLVQLRHARAEVRRSLDQSRAEIWYVSCTCLGPATGTHRATRTGGNVGTGN